MSAAGALLVCLLLLAYFGALRKDPLHGRESPGFGIYLALGMLLSPLALGALNRPLLQQFEPVARVGAAWLALIAGLGPGTRNRRTPKSRGAIGVALAGLVGLGVWLAVDFALSELTDTRIAQRRWLAAGAAVLASVTRYRAPAGPPPGQSTSEALATGLADFSRASAVVPAGVLVLLAATAPDHGLASQSLWVRAGVTLALGAMLGAVASVLLGREFRRNESWGILLGVTLLGTGISLRLGFSSAAAMLAMGLTITALSPHRAEIRALLIPTEKSILLPVALLSGASVLPVDAWLVGVLVISAVGGRLVLEFVRGALLCRLVPAARPVGPLVGLSMLSVGGFTLAAAVELNARLPSPLGAALLGLTVALALLGELLGGPATRYALRTGRPGAPGSVSSPANDLSSEAGPRE